MSRDEERVHEARPVPTVNEVVRAGGTGDRDRPTTGPESHAEDPEARQQSGREPLENVEDTLDKIGENSEIEGA